MGRVLRHNVVVHTGVNEFETLLAGQPVPKKFADLVTNEDAYIDVKETVTVTTSTARAAATAETVAAPDGPDYSKMRKPELEAIATERGIPLGTVREMQAALAEADKAAATADSEDVDLSKLDDAGLRALAAERSIDITDATSEEEIRALIENAE